MDNLLEAKEALSFNLKKLLKNKGINQGDLADKIGVSQKTLSQILNMHTWPDYNTLVALAKFFKVDETEITSDPTLLELRDKLKGL